MPRRNNYILTSDIVEEYDLGNRYLWPEFETTEQTQNRRAEVIRVLKDNNHKVGIGWGAYDAAIEKLKGCRPDQPCLSPVCPVCMSLFRRWNVSHGLKGMENADHEELWWVTWVPEPTFPPTYDFDPANFIAAFQRRIDRRMKDVADRITLWGYVELKVEPKLKCLVPHVHCFISGCTKEDIQKLRKMVWDKKRGRERLSANRIIKRPLVVSPVPRDQRVALFSYACKIYHGKTRQFPLYEAKGEASEKRKKMEKAVAKMFHAHRKFGFTKKGYKKFLEAGFRTPKHISPAAEHFNSLSKLSVHDMVVLRRMTRKGIDMDALNWANADHLERSREPRARRRRAAGARGYRGFSEIDG